MKTIFKVLAIVMVLGFISCTENEIEQQQNEKQEVLAIDKGDSTTDQSGGTENPDMDED